MLIGRRLEVTSPFFLAPINTGLAQHGAPTTALVDFHRLRAGKSIGVAYVGNIAIHPRHVTNAGTLHATSDSRLWPELAEAIERAGTVPGAQLATRLAPTPASRAWVRDDEEGAVSELILYLAALDTRELDQVAVLFGRAATAMAAHGFRVLQIHAAHGYLLSQLLTPVLNTRTDEYGRDPSLLLRRCAEEIRSAVPTAIVDIRVSLQLGDRLGAGVSQVALDEILKVSDMISVSGGHYELARQLIYPARRDGENVYLSAANDLARMHADHTWNCAGNVRSLAGLRLPSNMTVSLGRPLIADPEFVDKSLSGRIEEIRACDWNGACHYYTRGRSSIECPISEDLRRES